MKIIAALLLATMLLYGCRTLPQAEDVATQAKGIASGNWITIPAGDSGLPVKFLPSTKAGRSPAIFLVHGTNGPDARMDHWAKFFNQRGYNALIVDFKTGRFTGPGDIRNLYPYPLIEYARNWLLQQPTVDPNNVVWMGTSFGGALGIITEQQPWSAFVLFYPSCWNLTKTENPKPPNYWAFHAERPRVKPTLLVLGKDDEYQERKYCPEMLKLISGPIDVLALEQAHHGFDGTLTASFSDIGSPSGYTSVKPNHNARVLAEKKIIEFLRLPE